MIQSSRQSAPREREAAPENLQAVIGALDSRRSRDLLGLLGERAMTASEMAARTDIPRSSLYRYLNGLVEAGLVEESIRLDRSGGHETQYARLADGVVISMSDDGGFSVGLV